MRLTCEQGRSNRTARRKIRAEYRRIWNGLRDRVVLKTKKGVIESFSKSKSSRFQIAGSCNINGIAESLFRGPHSSVRTL